jgi:signal transduction histidine kinase
MRPVNGPVTVGGVTRESLAAPAPARPGPAAPGERRWLATVVIAACAGLVMLALTAGPYPAGQGPRLLFALVVCGPLVLLRRWPLPVAACAAAATGLVMAVGNGKGALTLGVILGLAVCAVASRMPRRWSIPVAATAAVIIGAGLIYADLAVRNAPVLLEAVEGFAPLIAAWFVGDSMAARRRYAAGLAAQAERERAAEAERASQQVRAERVRIARELHDVVAHTLAVMTVQAGVGRRLMAKRPEEARAALASIEMIGRTAQDELRVVLGLLRDEEAVAADLEPAPKLAGLAELAETVRASGTAVDLRVSGTDRQLSPALELSLYRVVQEALTNVVKHAPGARAVAELAVSAGKVRLMVRDDGGPDGGGPDGGGPAGWSAGDDGWPPGPGHGIVGMRERIGAFGGWLAAGPADGGGFQVTAEVPVEGAAS